MRLCLVSLLSCLSHLIQPVPPSSPMITEGGTVNESATVTITCEATGFPAPRIIWLKRNGTEFTNLNLFIQIPGSRISITNSVPTAWEICILLSSSNLTIDSVTVEDNGMYVCEVENGLPPNQMNSTNISVIGKYFMVKLLIFCFLNQIASFFIHATHHSLWAVHDECEAEPCQHGGICIDLFQSFYCNCTGTGYTGSYCQERGTYKPMTNLFTKMVTFIHVL